MSAMRQEDLAQTEYRFWSAGDDAVLRTNYGRVPTTELAVHLGRNVRAIRQHARKLGLAIAPKARITWTAAADARLRDGYCVTPTPELAAALGTTIQAVWARAKALGLKREAAVARLRAENDHLKHGALDAAHAPAADARRLAVLIAYRLNVIDAAEAAVVLGVPPARLLVEVAKAAKLGQDVTRAALEEGR